MIRDVPAGDWSSVLEQFSREHRAWLATLHVIEGTIVLTRSLEIPLKSATAVGDGVQLDFLRNGHSLRTQRPSALRIQLTEIGAVLALEMETVGGQFIRLGFFEPPPYQSNSTASRQVSCPVRNGVSNRRNAPGGGRSRPRRMNRDVRIAGHHQR